MSNAAGSKFRSAFTLIELLVVIALVAILAALRLPALARSKSAVVGLSCLENSKQLILAWKLYNDDNAGKFVPNQLAGSHSWVRGSLDYNGSVANTNTAYLIDPAQGGLLGPYSKNPSIYKCPSDRSCQFGLKGLPRVRSVSMSEAVGPAEDGTKAIQGGWLPYPAYQVYIKESEVINPGPAMLWVTTDEHPDGINDGGFAVQMSSPTSARWVDAPAPFHNGGSSFSFADGHAEEHRWTRLSALPPVIYSPYLLGGGGWPGNAAGNPDVLWLQLRTSARP